MIQSHLISLLFIEVINPYFLLRFLIVCMTISSSVTSICILHAISLISVEDSKYNPFVMINLHFYSHVKTFTVFIKLQNFSPSKLFTYVAMVGQTSDLKKISLSFPIAVIACVD